MLKGTPILSWTNPAPITYGTALSSNQLNATANVPGSFAYNPTNGTVLNAGTNTLSVIFTPTDTVDYSSVTNTVSLVVSPAPLTVTAANASRPYGQANPVFTGTITGVTNGDNITATYSCSATSQQPGGNVSHRAGAGGPGQPPDQLHGHPGQWHADGHPGRPGPDLDQSRSPSPTARPSASNQLNATASVPGSFAYTPTNGTVFNAGTNTLSVIFTPTDTVDYSSVTDTREPGGFARALDRDGGQRESAVWPDQPGVHGHHRWRDQRGQHHGHLQLQRDHQQPGGNLSHRAGAGGPGQPPDQLHGHPGQRHTDGHPGRPSSDLGQPRSPSPMAQPSAANQLNATANVPGSFAYTPTNGAVLNVGHKYAIGYLHAE